MGGIAKQMGQQDGNTIGKLIADAVKSTTAEARIAKLEKQVSHLTKLVHILWKEAEALEKTVQVTSEGLRMKSGLSEVLVLKNGGIILQGHRIHLKTPGEDKLMF